MSSFAMAPFVVATAGPITHPLAVTALIALLAWASWRLLGGGRRRGLAILAVAGLAALRVLYVWVEAVDLSGDEAYYWEWSRRLDWCYYSKGPIIALLIRAGTELLGHSPLGVRAPSIVLFVLTSILLYVYTRRVHGERAAAGAMLLFQITPLFAFYSLAMTIDAPLILFWTLSLVLLERAIADGRGRWWLALAGSVGLGLLSKYSMGLFYPCALLAMLASPQGRRRLKSPGPWLAVAASVAFLAPVLVWDSQHGWVNFGHNLSHTQVDKGLQFDAEALGVYLGSQLGIVTPVLMVMAMIAVVRVRRSAPMSFWFTAPILLLLLAKSVQGKVQPNWPMPAHVTAIAAFAAVYLAGYRDRNVHERRLTNAAVIVAAAVTLLMFAAPLAGLAPLPEGIDPSAEIRGMRKLGAEIGRISDEYEPEHFVWSERYQLTALLAFYMPDQPRTYCLDPMGRMSQYDLWQDEQTLRRLHGQDGIYVSYDDRAYNKVHASGFDSAVRTELPLTGAFDRTIRTYVVVFARDFHGYDCLPGSEKYNAVMRARAD